MSSIAKTDIEFTSFTFDEKEVRVVVKDGEPWFVAVDLCGALNLTNSRMSLQALDEDEKDVSSIYTPGGKQMTALVSDSGMYTLILRCRDAVKPSTIPYRVRKWVTTEVLPAIRKNGSYESPLKTREDPLPTNCRILHTYNEFGIIVGAQVAREDEFLTSAQGFAQIARKRGYVMVKAEDFIGLTLK